MSTTTPPPAAKKAAKKAAAPSRRGSGTYLPVLPDGWRAQVTMQHQDGHTATVTQGVNGEVSVEFKHKDEGTPRRQRADSLTEGCRVVAKGAKMLAEAKKAETEARKARTSALGMFGNLGDVTDSPGSRDTNPG